MLNIDWNQPKSPSCQTEGCNWPNFHVCIVGKPDLFPKLLRRQKARKKPGPRDQAWRDSISEAQKARWAKIDEQFAERNAEIVRRYSEETLSFRTLAVEYGISKTSVIKIVSKAGVPIRSKGRTIRHGAA